MSISDIAKLGPLLLLLVNKIPAEFEAVEARLTAKYAARIGDMEEKLASVEHDLTVFVSADTIEAFDAKVRAAIEVDFPGLDLETLEKAIANFGSSNAVVAVTDAADVAKTLASKVADATGVDLAAMADAISTATKIGADVVKATAEAHTGALVDGASIAVATVAGKEAALAANLSMEAASALSSVVASTVKVQGDTGSPVAQVAAAAVAHENATDDKGAALPGADPIGAAKQAASEAGADEGTADTIAHAVAAVAASDV